MLKERVESGLRTDETGVSPVIGVILMVAVTVIIAAVIGSTALGLGESVSETPPTAQFDIEFAEEETEIRSDFHAKYLDTITVEHVGGEEVDPENIRIQIDNNEAYTVHRDEDPSTSDTPSATYWGTYTDDEAANKYPDAVPIHEQFESDETISAGSTIPLLASGKDGVDLEQPSMHYNTFDEDQIANRDGNNLSPEEVGITEDVEVKILWESGDSSQVLAEETI